MRASEITASGDARARTLTLVACILGTSVVFLDQTVVNVALPALRADLGGSLADQQWVVEAYLLLLASLVLVGGSLGDLYGRRRVFAIGVAGFGLTSLACAVAPSVEVLIGARALQGAAGALLVPSSLAILTDVFSGAQRGRAIGLWTAWTSAAIAFGPPLGGALVDAISWRAIFAINVPLVLVCLWLAATAMARTQVAPPRRTQRVDVVGAALCVVGLGAPVYALIQQPLLGWEDPRVWAPLLAGLGALAAFVAYEARVARDPMLPPQIFASRTFAVGNLATLAVYAGLLSATFYVVLFLQQVAGYGALAAGAALTPITLLLLGLSSRTGALAVRLGPRAFMGGGPLVMALGLLLFARLDAGGDYLTLVLPACVVFGLGLALTVAPLTTTVLGAADRRHAGIASGVNNAIARVGGLLAIAVVGLVVSAQFGSALDERLPGRDLGAAGRAYVAEARERPLTLPDRAVAPATLAAAREANVDAFRAGMLVAALLTALGGAVALVGLPHGARAPSPGS